MNPAPESVDAASSFVSPPIALTLTFVLSTERCFGFESLNTACGNPAVRQHFFRFANEKCQSCVAKQGGGIWER